MAPSLTETVAEPIAATFKVKSASQKNPLKPTGALDLYESFDVTPVIGREFPTLDIVDLIHAPNSDELLKELAITISRRGVVFFRAQNNLTNDLQKQLVDRLGKLSGKPETSGLHIHPILNPERDGLGGDDLEISTISSVLNRKVYLDRTAAAASKKKQSSAQWHADISFEPVPADYTSLRLTQLPSTGGDTLWASGYELYDRISTPYQKFLEGLDATFSQPAFHEAAAKANFKLYNKERGSPENIGDSLTAIHPVIRTNPVTGWKSVFPVGGHVQHINGLTEGESKTLLTWFTDLLKENHDLQVRFKWKNENDLAIWDNRATFHSATFDYDGLGERFGNRAVGLGEKPFFDPKSVSRREGLEAEAKVAVG